MSGRTVLSPMTKYEATRVIGLRALQLSHGAAPTVVVSEERKSDVVYVAGRELEAKSLDACIQRGSNSVHVSELTLPLEVYSMLDTKDNGSRVHQSV